MGNLDVARWLHQKATQLLDLADADGLTPLHHASCQGHADVVDFLLQQGAQPNPLMLAVRANPLYLNQP